MNQSFVSLKQIPSQNTSWIQQSHRKGKKLQSSEKGYMDKVSPYAQYDEHEALIAETKFYHEKLAREKE